MGVQSHLSVGSFPHSQDDAFDFYKCLRNIVTNLFLEQGYSLIQIHFW